MTKCINEICRDPFLKIPASTTIRSSNQTFFHHFVFRNLCTRSQFPNPLTSETANLSYAFGTFPHFEYDLPQKDLESIYWCRKWKSVCQFNLIYVYNIIYCRHQDICGWFSGETKCGLGSLRGSGILPGLSPHHHPITTTTNKKCNNLSFWQTRGRGPKLQTLSNLIE